MGIKQIQTSESFFMAALLAVVGGFLDIHTYLLRGGVFANAQTGNIVLFGFHLAERNARRVTFYLVPVFAFMFGILIVEVVRHRCTGIEFLHWRQIIVAAEFVILLIIAFVPSGVCDSVVNISISFLCAMQVECFRTVEGVSYASTMCTGNLRNAAEELFHFMITKKKENRNRALKSLAIILFFITGVIIGTLLSHYFAEHALLFCCMLLMIGFCIMFKTSVKKGKRAPDCL